MRTTRSLLPRPLLAPVLVCAALGVIHCAGSVPDPGSDLPTSQATSAELDTGERAARPTHRGVTPPFESRVDPEDINVPTPPPEAEPLDEGPFIELPVPGHNPAVVSVPRGATGRRPLLVATHGAGDRPEPHCAIWRMTIGDRGFVLCPRGTVMGSGEQGLTSIYFYRSHIALGREISAALDALRARFPEHLDDSGPIYSGFSQGAIQGVPLIVEHPAAFSRLVLIEGGYGGYREWSAFGARLFHQHGGERALFACGGPSCVEKARRSAALLEDEGVAARVLHVEGAGHSYGGRMEEEVRRAFPWIVEGDPRWGGDARVASAAQ